MANYMKSEFYRILHGRTIYLLTLAMASLLVLMNLVLYLFSAFAPGFYYGTLRFSFIMLISEMEVFYVGAFLVVMLLSSDEYKNGVLKNAVAGGMNRVHMFIGKCIVYGITAMASAALILAVYIATMYQPMLGDAIEYGQWKTGVRSQAAMMGANGAGQKIGQGVVSAVLGGIMAMAGFNGTAAVQSAEAMGSVSGLFLFIPLVFTAIEFIIAYLYDLDKYFDKIMKELQERKQSVSASN